MLIAVIGILASVLMPTVGRVSDCGRRGLDRSNARQLTQAALIYAVDHGGQLPGLTLNGEGEVQETATTTNIHAIAAALARYGGVNDAFIWISESDRHPEVNRETLRTVLQSGSPRILSPEFAASALSFQFVAGLNEDMPATTPVVFTRGLRRDGQWTPEVHASVYGSDGGHVALLGLNVEFYRNLGEKGGRLRALDGKSTANILETIDSNQRIFSFPATPTGAIDGMPGIGERAPKAK